MNTLRTLSRTLCCALLAQTLSVGWAAAQSTPSRPLSQITFVRPGTIRATSRPIEFAQRPIAPIGLDKPRKVNADPPLTAVLAVAAQGCPPQLATCSSPALLGGSTAPTRFDR